MSDLSNYSAAEVEKHFDEFGIREWNRLVETPVDEVSLYIHTHYIKKYIQPNSYILEIGAGVGRFTQVLKQLNTKILVADISQVQLDLNKHHAHQHKFSHAIEAWRQVDICDMNQFDSEKFDCVVAYGGLFSYVLDKRDIALKECLPRSKTKRDFAVERNVPLGERAPSSQWRFGYTNRNKSKNYQNR